MEATAGAVRTAFIADDSQYSPTMRKMIRQSTELGTAATDAGRKIASAGHVGRNSYIETSAAVRLLSGDLENNIRAVEALISRNKVLAGVFSRAFPVVGGIAALAVVGKLVQKFSDFVSSAEKAPTAIRNAWSQLAISADSTNDKLAVTNDKLEAQIALLSGTPVNNLKTELDEARVAADALAESMGNGNRRMAQLLKDNKVTGLSGFINGQAVTSTATGSINSFNQKIQKYADAHQEDLQAGDTKQAAIDLNSMHDAQNSAIRWSDQQLKIGSFRQKFNKWTLGATGNYGSAITDVSSFRHQIKDERGNEQQLNRHNADTQTLKKSQQHIKDISTNHDNWEMNGVHSHAQEASYWQKIMSGEKPGSEAYKEAQRSFISSRNSANRESVSASAKSARTLANNSEAFAKSIPSTRMNDDYVAEPRTFIGRYQAHLKKASLADDTQQRSQSRIASRWFGYDSTPKTDVAAKRTASYEDQRQAILDSHEARSLDINRKQQTGQTTDHQAALAKAKNDSDAFVAQRDLLVKNLTDINKVVGNALSQSQRDAQSKPYRDQLRRLNASRIGQQAKDANAVEDTTWQRGVAAGAKSFFDQYSPSNIGSNITGNTLGSINSSITSGITTGKFHGASMVRGIAGNIGNNALGGLESKFLGPMFSKLGSKGNPMWTKSADGAAHKAVSGLTSLLHHSSKSSSSSSASGIGKFFGGIKSLFSSGDKSSDGSSGGGILGKLFSVATAIPFLAGGGDLGSGMAAIVGENGPELFRPKNAGTVIPNHKISSAMGGGQNITVDARGAMDPAATATAVSNAIHASARATQRSTVRSQHETKMRSPAHA